MPAGALKIHRKTDGKQYYTHGDSEYEMPNFYNTAYDDEQVNFALFQFAGNNDPAWVDFTLGAVSFQALEFAQSDEVFFTVQLHHNYEQGTTLYPHVHWTPAGRGNEENGKTVAWKVDVAVGVVGSEFAEPVTVDMTDACSGTDNHHELSPSTATLSGSGLKVSTILLCRLYRDAGDTWAGTVSGQLPLLLQFDIHIKIDSVGSDEINTKT
jgi:hypothetical protein